MIKVTRKVGEMQVVTEFDTIEEYIAYTEYNKTQTQ